MPRNRLGLAVKASLSLRGKGGDVSIEKVGRRAVPRAGDLCAALPTAALASARYVNHTLIR